MPERSADSIRKLLVDSFDDYHSQIDDQLQLVEALVAAVAREERERCAARAQELALAQPAGSGRDTGLAIASALAASQPSNSDGGRADR